MYLNEDGQPKFGKIILHTVMVLVGLFIIFSTFGTVGAGERGVKKT